MTPSVQIKRLRSLRNWSQATLARELKISQQSLSDWERGTQQKMLRAAFKLAQMLATK